MTQCAKIIVGFVANVGNVFIKRFFFNFYLNFYYIYIDLVVREPEYVH